MTLSGDISSLAIKVLDTWSCAVEDLVVVVSLVSLRCRCKCSEVGACETLRSCLDVVERYWWGEFLDCVGFFGVILGDVHWKNSWTVLTY